MHPRMSVVHARVPSDALAAMTRPSCVPNTTRPCETAGGISMRLSPGIRWTTWNGGLRPETTKRDRAGDAPNIGQLASGIALRLNARAFAGVMALPRNGPPSASRIGTKLTTTHTAATPSASRPASTARTVVLAHPDTSSTLVAHRRGATARPVTAGLRSLPWPARPSEHTRTFRRLAPGGCGCRPHC